MVIFTIFKGFYCEFNDTVNEENQKDNTIDQNT